MVGFGSSLRLARRGGWEGAYLDYEKLKLLLSQIEAVYEEEKHRSSGQAQGHGRGNKRDRDYRDELFLESDDDLAFASSDPDIFVSKLLASIASEESDEDEEYDDYDDTKMMMDHQGNHGVGAVGLSYSREEVSSSDDEFEGDGNLISECASSLTRPWGMDTRKQPALERLPRLSKQKKKRYRSAKKSNVTRSMLGHRDETFFVGATFNSNDDEDYPQDQGQKYNQQQQERADGMLYTEGDSLLADQQQNMFTFNNDAMEASAYVSTEESGLLSQQQQHNLTPTNLFSFNRGESDSRMMENHTNSIPLPSPHLSNESRGTNWMTLGTNIVDTKTTPAAKLHQARSKNKKIRPPRSAADIRKAKVEKERRKKRRARRRREIMKRKQRMEARVPRHLRVAHGKARSITERFLGLLRAEIEKVTLFAQSRLGELADTAGSLRFPSYDDDGGFDARRGGRDTNQYEILSDGGMHPSASSSEDERLVPNSVGTFPWSDTSDEDEKNSTKDGSGSTGASGIQTSVYSTIATVGSAERRKHLSSPTSRSTEKKRNKGSSKKKDDEYNAARRQISHFEGIRRSRPIFQRNDNIVGEDLLLLSAVDEADGYTAVGVELLHVLRFISVNVIALRKICQKHDRLMANRMLGGYYNHQRLTREKQDQRQFHKQKTRWEGEMIGGNNTNERSPIVTLGGIVSNYGIDQDHGSRSSTLEPATDLGILNSKLTGVYDTKLQLLANSSIVQVVSSCLALALSEYEVSRSRADALAQWNSAATTTPMRSTDQAKQALQEESSPSKFSSFLWGSKAQPSDENIDAEASSGDSDDVDGNGPPSTASSVSLTRLRFTVVSIFALREAARIKEDDKTAYIARSSLVFTGPVIEGLAGCSRETLDFFVYYNPDAALLLDSDSLHRGLGEGRWDQYPMRIIMLSSLETVISDANSNLERASNISVVNALSIVAGSEDLAKIVNDDKLLTEVNGPENGFSKVLDLNIASFVLNTMNYYIILPTASEFCRKSTGHTSYSAILIGAASFSALFIAGLHYYLIFKEATKTKRRKYSLNFFRPLFLLAAFFPIIGNILYAYAVSSDTRAMPLAILGRLLIGLGSSELLNRLVISNCVPSLNMVAESSRLVKSNCIGLAFSLLIGSLLGTFDINVALGNNKQILINAHASSSYLMASCWIVHLISLFLNFHDPINQSKIDDQEEKKEKSDAEEVLNPSNSYSSDSSDSINEDLTTPDSVFYRSEDTANNKDQTKKTYGNELKATYGQSVFAAHLQRAQEKAAMEKDSHIARERDKQVTKRRHTGRNLSMFFGRLGKVLASNIALPVTFALVLYARVVHEILFTSCAIIGDRYFSWSSSFSGLFLGVLSGFTLLIFNGSDYISRRYEERTVIKQSINIILLGLMITLNWASLFWLVPRIDTLLKEAEASNQNHHQYDWFLGLYQWIFGFTTIFTAVIVLESSTLSLMSKVAPVSFSANSLISCGNIITFLTLIGRIAGDIHIYMVGLSHLLINVDIVNSLFIPLILACVAAGYIVKKHFFFLL